MQVKKRTQNKALLKIVSILEKTSIICFFERTTVYLLFYELDITDRDLENFTHVPKTKQHKEL